MFFNRVEDSSIPHIFSKLQCLLSELALVGTGATKDSFSSSKLVKPTVRENVFPKKVS